MSLAMIGKRLARLEQAHAPSLAERQLSRWMTVCRESELDEWLARLEEEEKADRPSEEFRVWEAEMIREFEHRLAAGMTEPPSAPLEREQ